MACTTGTFIEVKLTVRKSSQTSTHSWKLFANEDDTRMCPMRAMIMLARLYGKNVTKQGPLFLKISKQGAVTSEPMVCRQHWLLLVMLGNWLLSMLRQRACLAVHSRPICRHSTTSHGHSTAHIHSVVEAVNTGLGSKTGLLPWSQPGEAGHKWRLWQCFDIFIHRTTITNTWQITIETMDQNVLNASIYSTSITLHSTITYSTVIQLLCTSIYWVSRRIYKLDDDESLARVKTYTVFEGDKSYGCQNWIESRRTLWGTLIVECVEC